MRRSSSVGVEGMENTLKNRGSMFLMIWPMALPLPAAPQPSMSTSTGSFLSFSSICWVSSFSLAASRRCFNSSFSGFSGWFQFFSMVICSSPVGASAP